MFFFYNVGVTRHKRKKRVKDKTKEQEPKLHPDIKRTVWVVSFLGIAIIFVLAAAGQAGPVGNVFYSFLYTLFGWGYYLLPVVLFLLAFSLVTPEQKTFLGTTLVGATLFVLSGLGLIDIITPNNGGLTGAIVGALETPFGTVASLVIMTTILIISFLVVVNRPLKLTQALQRIKERFSKNKIKIQEPSTSEEALQNKEMDFGEQDKALEETEEETEREEEKEESVKSEALFAAHQKTIGDYKAPPLSLLTSSIEKPTSGDLKANANIIRRTLEGFGIPVEMDEAQVGPTVTQYTLKPAEGVKLSRIIALNQDLALALAAHPIRIEAPIPGKSLVGIEVPNKTAAIVRLGSLLSYPEFQKSGPLVFVLGRGVNGDPVFADIEKMPHLLIAGATGSGKSIMIHSLITSLLYKNSPERLRLILIDPKRVELSVYEGIPHLIAPVIIENKKAISSLKWAISEMERRYELLLSAGARDIASHNKKAKEPFPYLIIVVDELADLMASYGREMEGTIIRLAQMSRATGIHLILSTQRPSVEVITGLIKANITSRVALQVASQIDSRTILDTAGAEKLLGNGDLLFVSAEASKPRRVQGAYITDAEVRKTIAFVKEHNERGGENGVKLESGENDSIVSPLLEFEDYDENGDELFNEAVDVVRQAKKASASLLQRRLRVGYARAARLLDMMEERGIVGPADGARPRDVYFNEDGEYNE